MCGSSDLFEEFLLQKDVSSRNCLCKLDQNNIPPLSSPFHIIANIISLLYPYLSHEKQLKQKWGETTETGIKSEKLIQILRNKGKTKPFKNNKGILFEEYESSILLTTFFLTKSIRLRVKW